MTCLPRFTFSCVVGILTTLAGCGSGDSGVFGRSQASGTVAVVLQEGATPQGQALRDGLERAAKEHDLTLSITTSGRDPAREASEVQRLLGQKVAALVVEPIDASTASADAAAAARAKVPFFTINTPGSGATAAHVESDYEGAGRVAAEYLATLLGGKGAVAVVRSPNAHGTDDQERGFRQGIAGYKGMSVLPSVVAADREGANAGALALLRSQRGVRALYATDPELALGATNGAYAARRADVAIVAFGMNDAVRAAVANAAEAPIRAVVVGQPRELGARMIEEVALQLSDEAVAARMRVPVRLVTRDSARSAP